MLWFYDYFFPAIWIAFLLYWQVKARNTKTTRRIEHPLSRLIRSVVFLAAIALLMWHRLPLPWIYRHWIPGSLAPFWIGAAVTLAGLFFAVWAREHLGANWSRSVTIKQDHQLITSGPYGLVRHPIYTGILAGFLGSAIATTQVRGLVALALVFATLWYKLRLEEQWMRGQFGETYAGYSRRVAALIPFVL